MSEPREMYFISFKTNDNNSQSIKFKNICSGKTTFKANLITIFDLAYLITFSLSLHN